MTARRFMRFEDFVEINPRVRLEKGESYPFIEMELVTPEYRYVRPRGEREFKSGGAKFQSQDTLFARITPCLENGKIAQVVDLPGGIGFGSTEFFVFRAIPDISDPAYVYYLASTSIIRGPAEKSMSGASGRQRVDLSAIKELEVLAPDLETQQKIAAILSAYDDLIENNLWRIKILEEMARNLYREWFVKFRFPCHAKVRMVDSPLGKIPEGWEIVSIDDVATVHRGRSYRSKDLVDDGGLPFVNLKCIDRDGGFRRNGLKRYVGKYKETQKVVSGDIVMAVTDMTQERRIVARAGRVPTLDSDFGVISMDLVKIEPREGISPDYLYGYFRGSDFADNVKQQANGANVLHLSPDRIKEYQFVLPSKVMRDRFTAFSGLVFKDVENLNHRNEILRKTRDLLLPKLISGELDVSELEINTGKKAA
ncbi:restriction endonuclease subunit S [Thiolapillus sp.]|uniref:restriction endonuclease subunit S n=1 Tax=Thiolapillus sp. TaxID=2017437 RepID=UPI0025EFAD4C|nr:restriction endonuclease subunit S [Thiolapillus sp.]